MRIHHDGTYQLILCTNEHNNTINVYQMIVNVSDQLPWPSYTTSLGLPTFMWLHVPPLNGHKHTDRY